MSAAPVSSGNAVLIRWPEQAVFGRTIPKSKIYEHSGASSRLKNLFVTQVEQIVWQYKLAPGTINLPARPGVQEVQVLAIQLKSGSLDDAVLRAIDEAISTLLVFEVTRGEGERAGADADGGRLQAAQRGGRIPLGHLRLLCYGLGAGKRRAWADAGGAGHGAAVCRAAAAGDAVAHTRR